MLIVIFSLWKWFIFIDLQWGKGSIVPNLTFSGLWQRRGLYNLLLDQIHLSSTTIPNVSEVLSKPLPFIIDNRRNTWRIPSSGMLRHVAVVRTDVSDELSASFISVTRIGVLGTALAVTGNRRTLRRNTKMAWYSFAAFVGCQLQPALILVHRFLSHWWMRR
jgi:hypothetical protein